MMASPSSFTVQADPSFNFGSMVTPDTIWSGAPLTRGYPQQQFVQPQFQLQPHGAHPDPAPPGMVQAVEFEAHDPVVKTVLTFSSADVLPTMATVPHRNAPNATSKARICELFQQGTCRAGPLCPEFHIQHEVLMRTRRQMREWLAMKEQDFNASSPARAFRVFCADLKEVIEVPVEALSFTRGLFLDPSVREKRSKSRAASSSFAAIASQVPTACGLFTAEPSLCKWGKWCNQAHVDPNWLRGRRGEFESWSASLESMFQSLPAGHQFRIHDPESRLLLLASRGDIAEYSRGLFQGTALKSPSVCLLFQRGRCTARSRCNQVHVHPQWLSAQRQTAPQHPTVSYADPPAYGSATPPQSASSLSGSFTPSVTQSPAPPLALPQGQRPPPYHLVQIGRGSPAPEAQWQPQGARIFTPPPQLNPTANPFQPSVAVKLSPTPSPAAQPVAPIARPPPVIELVDAREVPHRIPTATSLRECLASTTSTEWDFAGDEEFRAPAANQIHAVGREPQSPVRELAVSELNCFSQLMPTFSPFTKSPSARKLNQLPESENTQLACPKASTPLQFSVFFNTSGTTPPSMHASQLLFRAADSEDAAVTRGAERPAPHCALEGFESVGQFRPS